MALEVLLQRPDVNVEGRIGPGVALDGLGERRGNIVGLSPVLVEPAAQLGGGFALKLDVQLDLLGQGRPV